ncbi:nucleophile aminohydrolase [Limtongia smithiae]|uniref:nucleophile aminohydrolase n=1 Tax=Limtongia smithiae TaxID=1125753 RepID=UPI0034D02245
MCRFMIYKGREPILLAHLLTRPEHSIINQSFDSRLRIDMRRPINGDGFGVGYYTSETDPELGDGPCVFCATTPAWNNVNLARLAEKTKSSLVFAHVRASTSGVLSETNCHPFVFHSLMFMHNGQIANFNKLPALKRRFAMHVKDAYLGAIQGATDSEWAFALFLDSLDKLGVDPSGPAGLNGFPHTILREAMEITIRLIKDWTREAVEAHAVASKQASADSDDINLNEPSLLNFAVTDGHSVVVTRYITSRTEEAASLHFSTGSRFTAYKPRQYTMERRDRQQDVVLVASEPLTFERSDWVTIPTNTIVTINDQTVLLYPIYDEYYNSDPAVARSSGFAASRGLVSPIVQPQAHTNVQLPPLEREGRRRPSLLVA